MYRTTILIPEYRHPNFLEVCIEALIKNSRYKHKILIISADIDAGASDFRFNQDRKRYQKYLSVREFVEKRKKWLEDNDITFIDITDRRKNFRDEHIRNGGEFCDCTDIAFKDNVGVEYIGTKWFFWNWDDDFIAAPDWDVNLLKHVDESRHDRVYMPTHVQPMFCSNPDIAKIDPKNVWDTSSHVSLHRLTLPLPARDEGYLFESELNQFVKDNSRDDKIEELCHIRHKTHWLPMLIEKSLYLEAGGSTYKGTGFDIAFDDKLGSMGIAKVMSRSSFIIHRGYMMWNVTGNL